MKQLKTTLFLGSFIFLLFACANVSSQPEKKATKEISADEIIKKINAGEHVTIVNAIITDDLDFTEIKDFALTDNNHLTHFIHSNIFFENCVFMGNVIAYKYDKEENKVAIHKQTKFDENVFFFDCDFRKNVIFNECTVNGSLTFNKSIFQEKASFNHILVNGLAGNFLNIEANKSFSMVMSTFRGNINMMDAKFHDLASFSNLSAINVQMSNSQFDNFFDLSSSSIWGFFIFNYGKCSGQASLAYSRFFGRTDIIQTEFESGCSIERSIFYGKAKWNRSIFSGKINTKDALFYQEPDMINISGSVDSVSIQTQKTNNTIININTKKND